eukprot:403351732
MDTAEERWRRLIGIWLRINGKMYAETLNISINLTLNLAILLVKYCKVKPTQAEKLAYYEIYSLYKEKQKGLVKDMQFISEGDTLDLVKLQENNKYDITAVDVPPQTYVKNEAGGFRIQFLNRYIREVLERSKQIGGDLIKDQSCFNKPNMALNISNIGEYIVGGGSDLSYGTFSNAGVEKTELTSGATYNFFRKRRDSKFIEHSWSIQSCVESYQNQQIMESSDGGGLINCRMDLKKMIDTFQEFTTLESLFKFIKKIQDKSQFELRIAEFRGYKGNTNTIEIFRDFLR